MAVIIKPHDTAQFISGGRTENNRQIVGMFVSPSGTTGRKWDMRYSFSVDVQMTEIEVTCTFSKKLVGDVSLGVTDDPEKIRQRDVSVTMSDTTVSATFMQVFLPDTEYYLWVCYDGVRFETAYCLQENVVIAATPAASTLEASDGVLGEEQRLTIHAGREDFTHDVLFSVGSTSGVIAEGVGGTDIIWSPPIDLAVENTTGKSVSCEFTVITYVNGVENARSSTTVEYAIPGSCGPDIEARFIPVNDGLADKFSSTFVQGLSRVKAIYTATLRYDAVVSAFVTKIGTKTAEHNDAEYISDVMATSGIFQASGTVTDSRGFYATATAEIPVQEYYIPMVIPARGESAVVCSRCNADGVVDPKGLHLRIRAGKKFATVDGINQCILRYRISKVNEGLGDWVTLLDKGSDEKEISITTADTLDIATAYAVEIGVEDDIGNQSVLSFYIPTLDVPLHLGHGGKNIAIGRYCDYGQPYRVDIGWDIQMDTGVRLRPYPGEESEFLAALGFVRGAERFDFENVTVSVSDFEISTEYEAFLYSADIDLDGVQQKMQPEVVFGVNDAISGNFAPVADSYDGGVRIYAAEKPSADITIPLIVLWRR